MDLLSSYTTFIDESNCGASLAAAEGGVQPGGEGAADGSVPAPANNVSNSAKERIERLKRWFWNVIRGMNPRQRQDLVSQHLTPMCFLKFNLMFTLTLLRAL